MKKSTGSRHRFDGFNFAKRLVPLDSPRRIPHEFEKLISDKEQFEEEYRRLLTEPYFNIIKHDMYVLKELVSKLDNFGPTADTEIKLCFTLAKTIYERTLVEYDHLQTLFHFQTEDDLAIQDIKKELDFTQAPQLKAKNHQRL